LSAPDAGLSRERDAPVFAEPWEAKAFALQQVLYEKGVFTWVEWADRLSAEIAKADLDVPGAPAPYYRYWLRALEALVAEKGVAAPGSIAELEAAWHEAARNTPHGAPIELPKGAPPFADEA